MYEQSKTYKAATSAYEALDMLRNTEQWLNQQFSPLFSEEKLPWEVKYCHDKTIKALHEAKSQLWDMLGACTNYNLNLKEEDDEQ